MEHIEAAARLDLEEQLNQVFHALADPIRRKILELLRDGEKSVTELVQPFKISQPAISKHIKVLERAGLVTRSREAQVRPCRLNAVALQQADAWIATYRSNWESRFENVDVLLEELKRKK